MKKNIFLISLLSFSLIGCGKITDPHDAKKETINKEQANEYQEKTINNYKDLLKDGQDYALPLGITIHKDDVKSFDKLTEFIEYKIRNISFDDFADINDKHIWYVTGSWDYEHAIFNLVHILKTVDWEKDTILFYGW